VILASEKVAKKLTDQPVWLDGVGWTLDSTHWTNRDLAYPEYVGKQQRWRTRWPASRTRERRSTSRTLRSFDYKELHHLEGLQLAGKGEAPKMTVDGVTQRDGDLPVCPSGGLLGVGNPIAAAGMMKICEIFWQLRGEAGKRQVKKDARTGLAQAVGET